jgi:hypothetical protein
MKLVQILLPTRYNNGRRIPGRLFEATTSELAAKFGGLTAHTRAPVEGLWKPARSRAAQHDDLVIFEVIAARLDRRWWRRFVHQLAVTYRQQKIQTRVLTFIEL